MATYWELLGVPDPDRYNTPAIIEPEMEKPTDDGDFVRGFKTDMGQVLPTLQGLAGYAGDVAEKTVGAGGYATDLKNWGYGKYQEGMKALEPLRKDSDDVTVAWQKFKDGEGIGPLADWVQYGLGYVGGELVQTGVAAIGGAAIGGAFGAPAGGVGAIPGAATGAVTGGIARKATFGLLQKSIDEIVEKQVAAGVTREAAEQIASKRVAQEVGAGVAMFTQNYAKEQGSIYGEGREHADKEGRDLDAGDLSRMFGSAVVAAGLDTAADRFQIAAAMGKVASTGGRAVRAGTAGAAGAAAEIATEVPQTAIERYGAGKPLTGEEASNEYINAAGLAALGGGGVGAIGGAMSSAPVVAPGEVFDSLDTPPKTPPTAGEVFSELSQAKTVDEAIAVAGRMVDESLGSQVSDLVDDAVSPAEPTAMELAFQQAKERNGTSGIRPAVDPAVGEPAVELPADTGLPGESIPAYDGAAGPTEPTVSNDALTPQAEVALAPQATSGLPQATLEAPQATSGSVPEVTAAVQPEPAVASPQPAPIPSVQPESDPAQESQGNVWTPIGREASIPKAKEAAAALTPGVRVRTTTEGENVIEGTVVESRTAVPGAVRIQWDKDEKSGVISTQSVWGLDYLSSKVPNSDTSRVDVAGRNMSETPAQPASGSLSRVATAPAMRGPLDSLAFSRTDTLAKQKPIGEQDVKRQEEALPTGQEVVWQKVPTGGIAKAAEQIAPGMRVRKGEDVGTVQEPKKGTPPGYLQVAWDKGQGTVSAFAAGMEVQKTNGTSEQPAFSRAADAPTQKWTPAQEKQTRTPEFQRFFKGSQVTDNKGKPLVVYHGTNKNFNAFSRSKAIGGLHWFTTDKDAIDRGEVGAQGRGRVIDAFLSIKNPAGRKEYDQLTLDEMISRGYDGIVLPEGDHTIYVAFNPTQIKDTVNNRGTFDPTDPRIAYKRDAVQEEADASLTQEAINRVEQQTANDSKKYEVAKEQERITEPRLTLDRDRSGKYSKASMDTRMERVKFHTDRITKGWKNKPKIIILETIADAPERVRKAAELGNAPQGFILGADNVYLVADQLGTAKDVEIALLHEGIGHAGLRGFFGKDLQPVLDMVKRERAADVQAEMDAGAPSLDIAAEEVIVRMAETRPESSLMRKVIALVRGLIRKMGVDLKMSNAEIIQNVIIPARQFIESGGRTAYGASSEPAFSRSEESEKTPVFFSALAREVGSINAKAQPATGWKQQIGALVKTGKVKQDEIEWTGLNEWLDLQQGKVTKDAVQAFLAGNGVQVSETMLNSESAQYSYEGNEWQQAINRAEANNDFDEAERINAAWEDSEGVPAGGGPKYAKYQLPGGENYRELLLTLPDARAAESIPEVRQNSRGMWAIFIDGQQAGGAFRERVDAEGSTNTVVPRDVRNPPKYMSGHWDQANVLSHIRFNERTDADGKRVLFIEEIQSDWGQAKKKGGDVPSAPFVGKTDAWVALSIKRMIRYASENGFEKIAFVNGEQSASRYDLSKQVKSIDYQRNPFDGTFKVWVMGMEGQGSIWSKPRASLQEVEDTLGKEIAERMDRNDGQDLGIREVNYDRRLSGDGLKVGGTGMKTFYDQIVPKVAKDVLKKLGGQMGTVNIVTDKNGWHITPPEKTTHGKWMVKSSDYNSKGLRFDTEQEARTALAEKQKTSDQIAFTITPTMRETAMQGMPLFRRKDRSNYLGTLTPEQEAALNNIGMIKEPMTLKQRMDGYKANLGLRLKQGIADQFAAIKEVDQNAYMLARMSKGSDAALEAMMLYGKVFIRDGIYDVKISPDGGFAKVLADLDGEHDRFLSWVAAKRAERLKAEGKENLFTDTDISSLKTLNKGREVKFAKALLALNSYNESVLKIAMDSGLIDQVAYDLMKDQPYVPFYRVMEDDKAPSGPRFSSGLTSQYAFKALKGGKEQLNQDLLANMMQNWSHLFGAAVKNRAADAAVIAAENLGIAYPVSSGTKGSIKIMRDGQTHHYTIEDPYLFEAVSAVEAKSPAWMQPFSDFKRILTVGVTASPTFKIRNLIRDSLSAISTSDLSYNFGKNVSQGFKATNREGQTYASMLAGGGIIKFGSMMEGSNQTNRLIEKAMKKGTVLNKGGWEKLQGQVGELWNAYNDMGDRFENANRAALYDQLIAKGKSHAEASFMARDLMDFSMSGRWPVIRFLTQSVPFMNARIQGLYKLGRAAAEDPKRMAYMVAAVSTASIALAAAYADDDDWKKREDWDRDGFWWFKIGDKAFRIPKPFELGAMGTLAERSYELATSKEMTGKRMGERISAMLGQTFALNPTPQIVKPFLDLYSNKDAFTGRAIESMGMERLRPQDRYNERTTVTSRFLGSLGLPDPAQLMMGRYSALSPVQMDSLVRGYTGWLGVTTLAGLDYGLRPLTDAGDKPSMQLRDVFLAGNFVESLPSNSSRYVSNLYEQASEIEKAYASYRDAIKRGDVAQAKEIYADEKEKINKYKQAAAIKRQLSDLNSRAKQIESSKTMPPETKRRLLDMLSGQRNKAAESARL